MMARRAHGGEAGFAMLVVFLLAGFIAIGLYMELPRVVMESQRDREELLIDRGTQYKRAIQVFYRKFQRYPTDLDALDNTNNMRFLRRRYKDPMTGEDEWRLIHAAGPGIFTDSLVLAPPGTQKAEGEGISAGNSEEPATPVWMQRRPSDMILAGGDSAASPMPGMEETPPPQSPSESDSPAAGTVVSADAPGPTPAAGTVVAADAAGLTPAEAIVAMQTAMRAAPGGTGLVPGPQTGSATNLPSPVPTGPPPPGTIVAPQPGNQPPVPIVPGGMMPGYQGQAYPANSTTVTAAGGSQTTQTPNPAMQMINQLLTAPNPRAMAAAVQTSSAQQPLQVGGIAGVASKLESESIKIYNERSSYNEWEFIYDPRQDRTARVAAMPGNQQIRGPNGSDTSVPLTGPQGPNQRGPQGPNQRGPQGPGTGFPPGMNMPGGAPNFGQGGFGPGGTPQPQPGLGRGR